MLKNWKFRDWQVLFMVLVIFVPRYLLVLLTFLKKNQLVDNKEKSFISFNEQETDQIDFLFRPSTHSLISSESQVALEYVIMPFIIVLYKKIFSSTFFSILRSIQGQLDFLNLIKL